MSNIKFQQVIKEMKAPENIKQAIKTGRTVGQIAGTASGGALGVPATGVPLPGLDPYTFGFGGGQAGKNIGGRWAGANELLKKGEPRSREVIRSAIKKDLKRTAKAAFKPIMKPMKRIAKKEEWITTPGQVTKDLTQAGRYAKSVPGTAYDIAKGAPSAMRDVAKGIPGSYSSLKEVPGMVKDFAKGSSGFIKRIPGDIYGLGKGAYRLGKSAIGSFLPASEQSRFSKVSNLLK